MEISLYVKNGCFKCRSLEERLKANKIPFNLINTSEDEVAYDKAVNSGFRSFPLVEVDGEFKFCDLNIPRIDALMNSYKEQLV